MAMETTAGPSPNGDAADAGSAAPPACSRLPKKQLLSCGIEAHTIQKCPSPKKKALDPLRYMPERASYHALFSVVVRFEDHAGEYHALRSFPQFRTLHIQLQKKFPKSKLPKELPSLRKKRIDNQYIEQKSVELNAYLAQLVELAEVRQSKILRDFLEECPQSEGSDDDDARVLDGLPGTIVSVRPGQSFSVSLSLHREGDVASWQFTTKKHNIGFSSTFNGANVHVYSREESQIKPVKGSFKCSQPGTLTLDWDNTYTWSKTKVLVYWAEVEQARTLSSQDMAPASPLSDATPMLDARRSGYIAQSRNPSLYPRQIMNTSLSLITKPFVGWGRANQVPQFKSGLLIVERNVKFRGRNWYRKWFVLDARKCVLRYYDSEQASRKGLSLAKISLTTKNACLAITSQDEAAPTPFLFMVRARKRCWKLCASSQSEYNAWEHAISTAILTAQLKRRSARANAVPREEKHDANDHDDDESDEEDEDEDDEDYDEEEAGKEEKDDDDDDDEDNDSAEDENDADRSHPRDSTLSLSSMASLTTPLQTAPPPLTRAGSGLKAVSSPPRSTSFLEHWLGELRLLSTAKRLLLVAFLNAALWSLRSTSAAAVALLCANAYAVVHAAEAPRARTLGSER